MQQLVETLTCLVPLALIGGLPILSSQIRRRIRERHAHRPEVLAMENKMSTSEGADHSILE